MESSNLQIASYNSRAPAIDRIEYIRDLMKTNDILFVQEHWYMTSQFTDLESQIDNVHVIGISGMDDNELLYGRPYGGCAIIYDKQLKCTVTPVTQDSKCCMAVVVNVDSRRFSINQSINIYFGTVHIFHICTHKCKNEHQIDTVPSCRVKFGNCKPLK